jgi:predicted nucleotidyltransferase
VVDVGTPSRRVVSIRRVFGHRLGAARERIPNVLPWIETARSACRLPSLLITAGLACILVAAVPCGARADITFTDIAAGLPGISGGSVVWGDYDNDGDLDILLTGASLSGYISLVYRNDSGVFTDIVAGLTGVGSSSVAWGDYDNDGDLDILLTGASLSGYTSRVYRNDSGVFNDISAALPGVYYGSVAWGDYDNDGDLDILLTGVSLSGNIANVYRNDEGVFTDIAAGLTGVAQSSVAWGDYDNDGDLDILLTGHTGSTDTSRVYRNDGNGVFTDIAAGLIGVSFGSVAWGDYDNDGDLDILLAGFAGMGSVCRVYRNDGGVFAGIAAGLTDVGSGSVAWGDYDNDGDLDVLLTGNGGWGVISRVYRNDVGVFSDVVAGLTGVFGSSVAWGDYDNDGDLDILLTGNTNSTWISGVWRNAGAPANAPPSAPTGLSASSAGDAVTLSWDASLDEETPVAGLSYNLRIGTTPGGNEVVSAMASTSTGYRQIVALGSVRHGRSWTVQLPPDHGPCWWSVQGIDGAFAGSPFAPEQQFDVTPAAPTLEAEATPGGIVIHCSVPLDYANVPFRLHRRAVGEEWQCIAPWLSSDEGTVCYVDAGIEAGSVYEYEIEAIGPSGPIGRWGPVVLQASAPSSLGLRLLPNPTTDMVRVSLSLPRTGDVALRLFDAVGRELAVKHLPACRAGVHTLDESVTTWSWRGKYGGPLAVGTYWMRLETPMGAKSERWVILR